MKVVSNSMTIVEFHVLCQRIAVTHKILQPRIITWVTDKIISNRIINIAIGRID